MIPLLILLPLTAGVLAFLIHRDSVRRALVVVAAAAHAGLVVRAGIVAPAPALRGWLAIGSLEILFLGLVSLLSLAAAVYAVGYLAREAREARAGQDGDEGRGAWGGSGPEGRRFFARGPEVVFSGCFLLFLGTMTLVAASQHFGLMWVAVEATTLASAPLVHFHRNHRSLEAAWKYLVICSVGIAIALLGNFFLVVAAASERGPLTVAGLVHQAGALDPAWLKAAFLLLLVGYGTKMGLAPLHTWLPDAHSEAPSVVSALLSGALLNCAFLAILRIHAVCTAAGLESFSGGLLVLFGLVSMGLAAAFIVGQPDYKRMLAYSSVEHMGIASLGAGLGGVAGFGALLHVTNHSLAKGMLFLLAGNILTLHRTKAVAQTSGLLRSLPVTGALWVAGFLAITGTPPFGLFISEFTILKGALDAHRWLVAVLYLLFLTIIFAGMASIFLRMAFGPPSRDPAGPARRESPLSWAPPAVLGLGALLLGLAIPPPLRGIIEGALRTLGGH